MDFTRLENSQTNNTKFEFLTGKMIRDVALRDWSVPFHPDLPYRLLDLGKMDG
jgi:hypothetical protein